jgi:hypothetical protein
VRLAETLLNRKARICDRANKGHSTWPRMGSQPLENRAVSVLEERWCSSSVWMTSMIHHMTIVTTERKGNKETLWCFTIQLIHKGQTSTPVITRFWENLSNGQMCEYLLNSSMHLLYKTINTLTKKVQELPEQCSKVLDIRSPESKWFQLQLTKMAREANNTKGA